MSLVPVDVDMMSFVSLFGADRRPDPYPHYRAWREQSPLASLPGGTFVVSQLATATQVLRDPAFGHLEPEVLGEPGPDDPVDEQGRAIRTFLVLNPPDHTRLRRLVSKAFTPRMVERLAPRVEVLADDLLTAALDRGEGNLMDDLARPLPVEVIAELLGVPLDDREEFAAWSRAMARGLDPDFLQTEESIIPAVRARRAFVRYFRDLAAQRRRDPGEDLLSALVAVSDAGDALSEGELLVTLTLLLIAGHETTTNLIGNGVLALLRAPAGLTALGPDGEHVDRVIEEVLRHDSPVQLTRRVALRDTTVGELPVRAGQDVIVLLGAANRDPASIPDPEIFDPAREPVRHLAFGQGIHFCLGAPLARLEGRVAFRALARRTPALALAGDPSWSPTTTLRGLAELPVAYR